MKTYIRAPFVHTSVKSPALRSRKNMLKRSHSRATWGKISPCFPILISGRCLNLLQRTEKRHLNLQLGGFFLHHGLEKRRDRRDNPYSPGAGSHFAGLQRQLQARASKPEELAGKTRPSIQPDQMFFVLFQGVPTVHQVLITASELLRRLSTKPIDRPSSWRACRRILSSTWPQKRRKY